jgi:hypothetical protein
VGSYVGVGGPGRSACPSEDAGEVKGGLREPVDPTRPRGPPGEYPSGEHPHGAYPHGAYPHGAYPHGAYPHGAYPHGAQAERYSKRRRTSPGV